MNKIKVYVTCNWDSDENLFGAIKNFGFGSSHWKNVEFTLGDNFDRVIILRGLNAGSKKYDLQKAITFFTEPTDTASTLTHASAVILSFICLPFWDNVKKENREYVQSLGDIKKIKLLSSITSDKYSFIGHHKRIELLLALDQVVEEGLDIYGRDKSGEFSKMLKSHKGPLTDKFDGLWSYKYHFACENSFIPDYFTEKIADPLIAECLCFYDGCPNIGEFIDERAFIKIDVSDPETAINSMIEAIEKNEWRKRIKHIRRQKQRLLDDLNPLNIIWMAVNEMDVYKMMRL